MEPTRNRPETTQETSLRRTELQKTIQKTIQKTELQKMIIKYLKDNPKATQMELSENIENATLGGVKYNLIRLQESGVIKRVGGRKQGHWEVLDE